jgi:hypothetical protein
VLNLESDKPNAFDDADVAALQALADLSVVAIQRKGARRDIRLGISCEVNQLPSLRVTGAVRIQDYGCLRGRASSSRHRRTFDTRRCDFGGCHFGSQARIPGQCQVDRARFIHQAVRNQSQIRDAYSFTRGWMQDHPDRLHFQFECSRQGLRLPVEFLFDDAHPVPEYLALWHPMSWCVRGVATVLPSLSRASAAKPSSALFIAADTAVSARWRAK